MQDCRVFTAINEDSAKHKAVFGSRLWFPQRFFRQPVPAPDHYLYVRCGLCGERGNILSGVWGRPVYMSDAIHPNDQGYARIAARVADELRPLLPKLVGSTTASP